MKPAKFDEIVKARAAERVDARIRRFKQSIAKAFSDDLGIRMSFNYNYKMEDKEASKVLQVLCSDNHTKGWPKELWEREREAVTTELLSTMDEMQRALRSVNYTPESMEESDGQEG